MSPPIFTLPPELLARIFEYLAEDRRDISQCRLTNKSIRDASSPFLITEVVFAKRLTDIAKLEEVASHPYFNRHVTHLVYDLSHWKFNELDMNDSTELEEYIAACEEAEELEIRKFLDEQWAQRVTAESNFFSLISDGQHSANEATNFLLQRRGKSTSNGVAAGPQASSQESTLELLSYLGGDIQRMGCHKSFPLYKRNAYYHEQLAMKGISIKILTRLVNMLPKLRGVTFTDYRGLARRGETYQALCSRLFGNILEPERWNWQLDNGACTTESLEALEAITGAKGGLQSVSFGPHFYEMASFPPEPLLTYKEPHYLAVDELTNRGVWETGSAIHSNWTGMFKGLRSLRLPLLFEEAAFPHEEVEKLLHMIPDTVEHLALSAKGPMDTYDLQSRHGAKRALRPFEELIAPLRFPRLTNLELEGWLFRIPTVKAFLQAHASTLRTLHLINVCWVCDGEVTEQEMESDYTQFSDFAAKELKLTGVEIVDVHVCKAPETPLVPLEEDAWLTPGQWDGEDWDGELQCSDGPKTEAEGRCLGGRPNVVHRRRPVRKDASNGQDMEDGLGLAPAYW